MISPENLVRHEQRAGFFTPHQSDTSSTFSAFILPPPGLLSQSPNGPSDGPPSIRIEEVPMDYRSAPLGLPSIPISLPEPPLRPTAAPLALYPSSAQVGSKRMLQWPSRDPKRAKVIVDDNEPEERLLNQLSS
ncbi:hypothetical protein CJ030_MR3G008355 [Morella rubra]|uniref:Uncharacterized protein n=1 Tax=Morella rubra TaxID=262757 RepID=A0A6A1W641_9ROSI|nr:hypothetical protein CJ030_MR3G008355 [Morella rubra]